MDSINFDFLKDLQNIKQQRLTIQKLIDELIAQQKPLGYSEKTTQEVRVQENKIQKEAETVYRELQELIDELKAEDIRLLDFQVQCVKKIKSEIKDPVLQIFLIKRFCLNESAKKIMFDLRIPKSSFYKKFKDFF
ncbi:hypothetical protein IJJ97_05905 [bacterium]|nr:hypothetical protein [bacterium]